MQVKDWNQLVDLIRIVCKQYGCTKEEFHECVRAAKPKQDEARECYAALAAELGLDENGEDPEGRWIAVSEMYMTKDRVAYPAEFKD